MLAILVEGQPSNIPMKFKRNRPRGIGGVDVKRFFYFKLWWPFCSSERNDFMVGSYLGNIPMKFELHWPKGSGGVSFKSKLFTIFYF